MDDRGDLQRSNVENGANGTMHAPAIDMAPTHESVDMPLPITFSHPAKKPRSDKAVLIGVIAVLLVIIAVLAVWLITRPHKETAAHNAAADTRNSKQSKATSARELNDQITVALEKLKATSQPALNVTAITPQVDPTSSYGPAYKVPGADYYVMDLNGYGANISDARHDADINAALNKAALGVITNTFDANGLKKTDSLQNLLRYVYQSSTIICSVNSDYQNTTPIGYSCADTASYKPASETVAPFAKAYAAGSNQALSDAVFSSAKITDSKTPGYQTASLSISMYDASGGAMAMFYKNADGDWHYFTSVQGALQCSAYNSVELRQAYAGETCGDTDTATTSTVK